MKQYEQAIKRLDEQIEKLRRDGWNAQGWEMLGLRTRLQQEVNMTNDWITAKEAAQLTGCSVHTIRRAIKLGRLPAVIPGGGNANRVGYRVRKADLWAWFYARSSTSRPDTT
jgi:excisionase family DNA binding protein